MERVQGINFKGQNDWDNIEIFPSLLNHARAAVQNIDLSGQRIFLAKENGMTAEES